MNYHKIRGVDLSVCTAEQMIAYNAAFRMTIGTDALEKFRACETGFQRYDVVEQAYQSALRELMLCAEYGKISRKYDVDAIGAALHAGMENYLSGSTILTDYAIVGKTFPALYLNK